MGPQVFRPLFVRVLSVVVWVTVAVFATMSFSDGAGLGLRSLPPLLLVAVVAYALFWRPCVRVDNDSVTLVNVLRDVHVPFGALEAVTTRFALAVRTPSGDYTAWAAPAPGRTSSMGLARRDATAFTHLGVDLEAGLQSSAAPNTDSGGAALLVQHRWERWRSMHPHGDPEATVTVRLIVPVAVLLVLTLLGSVAALLV